MKSIFYLVIIISLPLSSYAITATWIGTNGNWDLAANWSTGVVPDASTDVVINGLAKQVTIPSNFNAEAKSVSVESFAKIFINTDATLTINGSSLDGITINNGAILTNEGIVTIGNITPITQNAVILVSSAKLINAVTGVININNVGDIGIALDLVSEITNSGAINMGSVAAVNGAGFAMNNESKLTNLSTGIIQVNNILAGDGFYMQLSDVINQGEIHIGNIHPILNRGISLELSSDFSNGIGAKTTINNVTSNAANEGVALFLGSNSNYLNSGSLIIGILSSISNNGISLFFESELINFETGTIEISNIINFDAVKVSDEFTNFINSGSIKIGKDGPIKGIGIILTSLATFINNSLGSINIDNIIGTVGTQGIGIYLTSGFTNHGIINMGSITSISQFGILISSSGSITNQTSGNIQINNILNFDGIWLTGSSPIFTNNGTLHIGNLLAVKNTGISMFSSSNFLNNASGIISINNITSTTSTEGFGLFIGNMCSFTNKGLVNIGNISTISNLGIFVSAGTLINQNSGIIQINNILTFDGIFSTGTGSTISNQAMIKIGNTSPVKRYGIYLTNSSIFQNSAGSLEINNINSTASSQGYGIVMTSSSSFTNNTEINIGNFSNISQIGLYVGSPSTFTNQASGVIKISRINSFDGIQLVGAAAVFNNAGQIKIGESGPINRIGILNSSGQFNNQAGGLIEINNIPTLDGMQVFNTGANLTNNGTIHIGNISGVYRFGILGSSSSTFTNGLTGILTINNILSTSANEGIAFRLSACTFTNSNLISIGNTNNISRFGIAMSSTSTLTNLSTGLLEVNRIGSQSAISLQTTSKILNSGTLNIGNIAPIQITGLLASGGAEIQNNSGGIISINNVLTNDAINLLGTGTKLVNASQINIGNLSTISRYGIFAEQAALFQNNNASIVNVSNTNSDPIVLDGTSTILNNKGLIHVN